MFFAIYIYDPCGKIFRMFFLQNVTRFELPFLSHYNRCLKKKNSFYLNHELSILKFVQGSSWWIDWIYPSRIVGNFRKYLII